MTLETPNLNEKYIFSDLGCLHGLTKNRAQNLLHSLIRALTHPHVYSYLRLLFPAVIPPCIHISAFTHPCFYSSMHSLIYILNFTNPHLLIHRLTHPCIHSSTHSLTHAFTRLGTLIHELIHTITHPCTH